MLRRTFLKALAAGVFALLVPIYALAANMSETYVDPSIAANSGSGTIGDPYGDLQYALNTMTRDGTNGDRINIKAGTAEVLTAAIDLTSYGTPATNARLRFEGYTSAAGDGGVGTIEGTTNNVSIFSSTTLDYIMWVSLDLQGHSVGNVILCDDECGLFYSKISGGDNTIQVHFDQNGIIVGNEFNTSYYAIDINSDGTVVGNYFSGFATASFGGAVLANAGNFIARNIISKGSDAGGKGIIVNGIHNNIINNSILAVSGTGAGIHATNRGSRVLGNIVEGFSGTGGYGYLFDTNDDPVWFAGNAAYNNDTDYDTLTDEYSYQDDNETLSTSGFAKSGSDTYANRHTYFAPVDTGNIIGGAGAYAENVDKGAIQSAGGGGGGSCPTVGYGGA